MYDVAFLGNYTKDTIVSAAGTRVVDGGAFNYGAHVAACMGLHVAAVTRLAQEDYHVVEELKRLGVDVFVCTTPQSTCLRLEYPTSNVDERTITVESTAGSFTPAQVQDVQARAFVVGPSLCGEVGLDVIEALARGRAASAAVEQAALGRNGSPAPALPGCRAAVEQAAPGRDASPAPALPGRCAILAADVQGFVRVVRESRMVYEAWPEREAILSHVDVLKTDAVEAEMLTGTADIRAAAQMLAALGPREIVLTHRNGVLVYAGGEFHEAGFFPERLVGRSGRGDTCLAAYVARRLAFPPAEATRWAAAVTSLKMEAEGPFRRDIGDVEEFLGRYDG
jgi:sugar/nucleoside kinase (ribokinase family)